MKIPSFPANDSNAVLFRTLSELIRLRREDAASLGQLDNAVAWLRFLDANMTVVGNVGTGEDDLMTYTLPDGLLKRDNWGLRITSLFTFANNANNKRVRLYLGGSSVYDTTAVAAQNTSMVAVTNIIRTGDASQVIFGTVNSNDSTIADGSYYAAGSVNLLAAATFKATGEATSTDDIVQRSMLVEWLPFN